MNRVKTAQAAAELGMAPETVRYLMEIGKLDIGLVAPSKTGRTKRYYIFRDKLDAELGKRGE